MLHRVVRRYDRIWGPTIWTNLVQNTAGQYITSEYRPGGGAGPVCSPDIADPTYTVPTNKWCKVITRNTMKNIAGFSTSSEDSLLYFADNIDDNKIRTWFDTTYLTIVATENPALLVLDELSSDLAPFVKKFFDVITNFYPAYKGKFGAYIWPGTSISYDAVTDALTSAFNAWAFLCPEMYFPMKDYCAQVNKNGNAKADEWLQLEIRDYTVDNPPKRRMQYLYELKTSLSSPSVISPVVATTNIQLNGADTSRNRYMDRVMLQIGKTGMIPGVSGIGSYKWDYDAIGVQNEVVDQSVRTGIISGINVPDATQCATTTGTIDEHQYLANHALIVERANVFVDSWKNYCQEGNRTARLGYPDCKGPASSGGKKPTSRAPGSRPIKPRSDKSNNRPRTYDLIEAPPGADAGTHAYLAKVVVPLTSNIDPTGKKASRSNDIQRKDGSVDATGTKNIKYWANQIIERFDLWVDEVTYGYGTKGTWAASKYYRRYYHQSFAATPIVVKGTTYDEWEYEDLGAFIREQQIASAWEPKNILKLYIPAAGISVLGYIELFKGGVNSNNQGVPVAPKFEFDFTILYDLSEPERGRFNSSSHSVVEYFTSDAQWIRKFNSYRDDYIAAQILHDQQVGADDTRSKDKKKATAKNKQDISKDLNKLYNSVKKLF